MAPFGQKWPVPEKKSEAYECLDPLLNRALGYGKSAEQLAKDVKRGMMGLHGLLALVEHFVAVYEVPGELLEGKFSVLFEAVRIAYVSPCPDERTRYSLLL